MNKEQIRRFVMDYLEATDCHIMESTPFSVTVKLSERADRQLTNRPYYWSFIDRTNAEPETMRFTFVFDQSAILPEPTHDPYPPSPHEEVTFGSRRLMHIMQATHEQGRFISLFAIPDSNVDPGPQSVKKSRRSTTYEPWLLLNLKVEFACDLKREEIHSYGISLVKGHILTSFMEQLQTKPLTPKLPPHIHIVPWKMTLEQAYVAVEAHITQMISIYDDTWASEASKRLNEELARLSAYYEPQLRTSSEPSMNEENTLNKQAEIRHQYEMRSQELRWQFEPRIRISLLNAGLIHLPSTTSLPFSSESQQIATLWQK